MGEMERDFSEGINRVVNKDDILAKLGSEEKQAVFYETVFNSRLEADYPLGVVSIRKSLKMVVETLEAAEIEVNEGLYEKYICSLSNSSTHEWRHYSINDSEKVALWTQAKMVLQNGTTGLSAWPAAWALAEFGAANAELFSGKRVLELGSGLGIGGLMHSALTRPSHITLTDVHSEVLSLLDKNAAALTAQIGCETQVKELDWCSTQKVDNYDVVVGADLLYDPAVFPDLVKLLTKFENSSVILAATIRNEETWGTFCRLCDESGLTRRDLNYDVKSGTRFNFDRSTLIRIIEIGK